MTQPPIYQGLSFTTPGRTIGEADIHLFAGLVGDFTPIHVDQQVAEASVHGTRIAHGPLGMGTAIGLATLSGIFGERVLGLRHLDWDFPGPIRMGDTIRSHVTVAELRPTSKPGRSLAVFAFDVINQHSETVQRGRMTVVLRAEP